LIEFRCQNYVDGKICNKLLAKTDEKSAIEIKCPRCGSIQSIKPKPKIIYKTERHERQLT
jgi:phage FluMu protein Com